VSFVVANQQHDMHSGSIRAADHWLKSNLGAYAAWTKSHNSLLIITWDEGRGGGNHIPTIFFGAKVRKGNFAYPSDHYRLLRSIENMYGLTPLGAAADNAPLRKIFTSRHVVTTMALPIAGSGPIFSNQPIAESAWRKLEATTTPPAEPRAY
jgi:hypothetical protein